MDVAGSCGKSIQVHDNTLCHFRDTGRSWKVLLLEVICGTKSKRTGGKGTCSWEYCTHE